MKVLDIQELSAVLKKSPATIRSDMVRNPASLPPWFKLPGGKKPLWVEAKAIEWVLERAEAAGAAPENKTLELTTDSEARRRRASDGERPRYRRTRK